MSAHVTWCQDTTTSADWLRRMLVHAARPSHISSAQRPAAGCGADGLHNHSPLRAGLLHPFCERAHRDSRCSRPSLQPSRPEVHRILPDDCGHDGGNHCAVWLPLSRGCNRHLQGPPCSPAGQAAGRAIAGTYRGGRVGQIWSAVLGLHKLAGIPSSQLGCTGKLDCVASLECWTHIIGYCASGSWSKPRWGTIHPMSWPLCSSLCSIPAEPCQPQNDRQQHEPMHMQHAVSCAVQGCLLAETSAFLQPYTCVGHHGLPQPWRSLKRTRWCTYRQVETAAHWAMLARQNM